MTDLKSKLATATSSLLRRRPANTKFNMHGKACTPKYSLEPKLEQRLTTWEDLDDRDLFLAHPVTLECFLSSDPSRRKAEDVIEEGDVFSTSLASYGNPASVPWTRGIGGCCECRIQALKSMPCTTLLKICKGEVRSYMLTCRNIRTGTWTIDGQVERRGAAAPPNTLMIKVSSTR